MENYIRFDWAMKRLLRNKANHAVLEGLMTSLLGEKLTIVRFLESEANQQDADDKFNRVDLLAEGDGGELIIVEIQNSRELTYFHRMLYGVSKAITDYIGIGEEYGKVRKVYSINIVYFELGQGCDYVYHGKTVFQGLHEPHDILKLSERQQERFLGQKPMNEAEAKEVGDLFPEYYVLRVNDFDKVAVTPLDEWMEFLKTGNIRQTATAPGLPEARECLRLDSLSSKEKNAYMQHIRAQYYQKCVLETNWIEGHAKGVAEGIAKGKEEGMKEGIAKGKEEGEQLKSYEIARKMLLKGIGIDEIAELTGLSKEEIGRMQ